MSPDEHQIEELNKVLVILADLDLRFTSGNSIPVEQATIKSRDYTVLKSFIMSHIRKQA